MISEERVTETNKEKASPVAADANVPVPLDDVVKNLPELPGVYLMKDNGGRILYIGKAISLKKRVSSYFRKSAGQAPKVVSLVPQIRIIDYIVTSSELEALILENNLIKKHKPKYNVILKDDKNYPYLCLTITEKYPRLIVVRKVRKDGNLYFGPYIPAIALRKTLRTIQHLFPLRQCPEKEVSKRAKGAKGNLNYDTGSKPRSRPCLQHQMKRCTGPCAEITSPGGCAIHDEYQAVVRKVKLFLLGKKGHLLADMEKQMLEASERLEYEKAAQMRDQIWAIQKTLQPQDVFSSQLKNKDIIGFARSGDLICFVVFFVRYGQLMGKKDFLIRDTGCCSEEQGFGIRDKDMSPPPPLPPSPLSPSDEEALGSFIKQFYAQEIAIPRTILLGQPISEARIIETFLSEKRGSAVTLLFPKSGEGKRQIDLTMQNARILLDGHLKSQKSGVSIQESGVISRVKNQCHSSTGNLPPPSPPLPVSPSPLHEDPVLRAVRDDLHLPHLPSRIEGFDISNLAGEEAVGSLVCWIDNKPAKSEYRRFKIKQVTGIDDYAMIRETVHRRYARLLEEGKGLPDLILIDGGKGHLQAGLAALGELNISGVPVAALAKREEEIFLAAGSKGESVEACESEGSSNVSHSNASSSNAITQGGKCEQGRVKKPCHSSSENAPTLQRLTPITHLRLSRHSSTLQLLQRIRDEAHRFAITYHRKLRGKSLLHSQMLEIEGVGPVRQKAVLRHFGSMARVKEASLDRLAEVPGLDSRVAQRIFQFFHPKK